ncbi:tetratricopeptide repeat protein [Microbulbifer sp. 2201CG32-9]|uniref:tetratricopeptide repeat protein n=1 Tax=Microbulbifer sp. 2201CG32-9 TaxID=3232309 RepID=UPI00345B833A
MQHRNSSSQDDNLIRPAEFSFGGEQSDDTSRETDTAPKRQPRIPPRLKIIVPGALLVAGVFAVFFVLPQMVGKPTTNPAITQTATDQVQQTTPAIRNSPYSDAEIAQQRRKVQEILTDILIQQEELEERKVDQWANDEFQTALDFAKEADGIYQKRQFKRALDKYSASLAALQQLRDSIPARIEQHLADGQAALERGDAKTAQAAFELVLTISEGHPRGLQGLDRAAKLPQVWQQFTRGRDAFAAGELDEAQEALREALRLDPETRPARELLPQVTAAIGERNYTQAMSTGYAAIAAGDFTRAKTAFLRAQSLKPQSPDPAAGLQQADNGLEQQQIERLFSSAHQAEQSEQWHQAVAHYAELIKMDASLVAAITGKAQADARAKLDDQLQELLDDPLSLGASKRNQYARKVLADARQIHSDTPRLQGQINALTTALAKSLVPVSVRLRSDSSTQVTIYHVGQLGNFLEREIALKPGRYTAVGTRAGYRDVRREFTVEPGAETPVVVIQCAEKIISANNS